ncbi:MAG: cob(I)yrinic acid a,c-diamide adenosyltransferase [Candidatus Omnitrophica bacterium]|nr:cob(I)yrinic acid a,c-diamide adenosyltransferase [Candidatus Omnitrophota bacterium]
MIQVYTGNGKGKTTAAMGLALRAAGAGFNVYICQFAKGHLCSEHKALKKLKNIKVEQFGRDCFVRRKPVQADIILAHQGLEKAKKIIACKKYRLVILDEINIALKLRLVSIKEVLDLIKHTPKNMELVLTGRDAPARITKVADLVSDIKDLKHYYLKGIKARRGIEL